jgi:hypothetical protein
MVFKIQPGRLKYRILVPLDSLKNNDPNGLSEIRDAFQTSQAERPKGRLRVSGSSSRRSCDRIVGQDRVAWSLFWDGLRVGTGVRNNV